MAKPFKGFDLAGFWEDSDYARKEYVEPPPGAAQVAEVEAELGFRLPASYVALMRTQNGGIPKKSRFRTETRTSWAEDHIAITGLAGIGRAKSYSLCGQLGSRFMQREWGYPEFGVCIGDCPSAGHDMVMLDYRECGPTGEPQVVHVDQEANYKVTFLAKDFESFVRGLVDESEFDTAAEDLEQDLAKVDRGAFSARLKKLVSGKSGAGKSGAGKGSESEQPQFGPILRRICRELTEKKGYFALHADALSLLVYDLLFYLHTERHGPCGEAKYLELYPELIVFGDGGFSTGGYAPGFVSGWIKKRIKAGAIVAARGSRGALQFSPDAKARLLKKLKRYAD